jgi:SAM-dependent methyltransferase
MLIDLDHFESLPLELTPAEHLSDRFWFVQGPILYASYKTTIAENRRRVAIIPKSVRSDTNQLNFAAIPSVDDLKTFVFPGAERAQRVAGGADTLHQFASGGLTQALQLFAIVDGLEEFPYNPNVLDWGSGAGRVLQFVAREKSNWRVRGADIDAVNVRWCTEYLSHLAEFATLELNPPSRFQSGSFDLIYGLSVITHLEQASRNAWLTELLRLLRPGGFLIITYMGTWAALQCGRHDAALDVYKQLEKRGLSDELKDFALGEELSRYYKATYNTRDELMSVAEPKFQVIAEFPRSLCYQDAVVLRKPEC